MYLHTSIHTYIREYICIKTVSVHEPIIELSAKAAAKHNVMIIKTWINERNRSLVRICEGQQKNNSLLTQNYQYHKYSNYNKKYE